MAVKLKKGLESPFFIAEILSPEKYMRKISQLLKKSVDAANKWEYIPNTEGRIKRQ